MNGEQADIESYVRQRIKTMRYLVCAMVNRPDHAERTAKHQEDLAALVEGGMYALEYWRMKGYYRAAGGLLQGVVEAAYCLGRYDANREAPVAPIEADGQ